MSVRSIDNNWDWNFGAGIQSYVSKEKEISQMVKTRLLSFLGDCFFATDEGIDWINLLGKYGEERLLRSIKLTILNTEGVVGINKFDVFRNGRNLTVTYDLRTIYSRSYLDSLEVENV